MGSDFPQLSSQFLPDSTQELRSKASLLLNMAQQRDGAARLLVDLPNRFSPLDVSTEGEPQRLWELCGLFFVNQSRWQEALPIFQQLYQHMLKAQEQSGKRTHKGMPLCWISDCFYSLGYPLHAKRYLLLTLCEDAIREKGNISPNSTGSYFRLVWRGMPDGEFRRYAKLFSNYAEDQPKISTFPEALLQSVDDDWLTEVPSAAEAFVYSANSYYVSSLLTQLGTSKGTALETLAEYLLSCMPGCRTRRRARSGSTDYDVVCSMEGFEVDFRSELGRYFVCECKDWSNPADFTTMAKFCRVLDSFKARFGILFSSRGITGRDRSSDAGLEQLKVFQDRGIVVVVIDRNDLEAIASGRNLISLLRTKYEAVRLDIR
jgi:hypothetical protein